MEERDAVTTNSYIQSGSMRNLQAARKGGTLYKAMLRVLMKLPLLSFKAMEEDDLQGC